MRINYDKKEISRISTINNISLTAYRSLIVLSMLLQRPCTQQELLDTLNINNGINKPIQKDTLRIILNTLKMSGCVISRPTNKNFYKYTLIQHPFHISLTDEEIECLNILREKLFQTGDYKLIFKLNNLYRKIAEATGVSELTENEPLNDINKNLLEILNDKKNYNKQMEIEYLSAKNGLEVLEISVKKLTCENKRIYVHCFVYKHNMESILDITRIKSIKKIGSEDCNFTENTYIATYTITNSSEINFVPLNNEKVINKNGNSITVSAEVNNEFIFIQRLLQFGDDLISITPQTLKNKVINKLKLIREAYLNEK